MERSKYDLSHIAHLCGQIGRLQTVSVIPVVGGDSIEINLTGLFRLAPTRKEVVAEAQIDICAFFVPHRHVFPTIWPDMISEGQQTTSVLTSTIAANADSRDPFYLGIKQCGANVNQALVEGYNRILQRYFAVPTTIGNGTQVWTNYAFYPNGTTSHLINHRRFGARIARLPHIFNGPTVVNFTANAGGYTRNWTSADYTVNAPVSGANAVLDIKDLRKIQARYRSTQEQNYFASFYNDVMEHKFGAKGLNTDADPRPTYLGRDTHMVSGSDINGHDDATLGSYVGKTIDSLSFHLPRRYMPEHGNVWVMMAVRFPLVHTKEQHPLLATAIPDNTLIMADPNLWAAQPVVAFDPSQWMAGGSLWTPDVTVAQQPYGQEYRYQPNRVHPFFESIPGYPFTNFDTANLADWYYYKDNEYVECFQTSQIGQWQAHMRLDTYKYTSITDPRNSIMAGARG